MGQQALPLQEGCLFSQVLPAECGVIAVAHAVCVAAGSPSLPMATLEQIRDLLVSRPMLP